MTILSLLRSNSRRDMAQAIKKLQQTNSPYAMKALRMMYSEEQDARAKEFIKKAMFHLRKSLVQDFKDNKGKPKAEASSTELNQQIDAMMALAYLASMRLEQQVAEKMVMGAYSLRPERFTIQEYRELAAGVLAVSESALEVEMEDYLKHKNRIRKSNSQKYGTISYLMDIPVALLLFFVIAVVPFYSYVPSAVRREMTANYNALSTGQQTLLMGGLAVWVIWSVIRIWMMIGKQFLQNRQNGWQSEVKQGALDDLHIETAGVLGVR